MTLRLLQIVCVLLMFLSFKTSATTLYVSLTSTNPVPPYNNWTSAATKIQDAVDAANPGDTVLVTNGVYATGGRMWYDSGTNRVTLTKAITLQSVNGPGVTLIVGNQVAGTGSVLTNAARCVGMGNNAVLSGFTLTNGEAGWGNYPTGGGVANLVSGVSTVTNCVLIGDLSPTSYYSGGGADRVTLINCKIIGNYAGYGGGASRCALINCTVVSNTALSSGGGVYEASALVNCTIVGNSASGSGGGVNNGGSGAMNNCIVYYNTAPTGSNYSGIKMNYCCTTPTLNGDLTSFTNAPLFANLAAGDYHLIAASPCINAGNNSFITNTTDLDGNPRIIGGTVDIGAYEFQAPVRYVNVSNTMPVSPFTSWATAATNIQDAVDASTNGDLILVTNGVYATGGRLVSGLDTTTNRLAVTNAVTVQSVNGPTLTVIQGYQVPGTTLGASAVRCVYMTDGATLAGFTLTNGASDMFGVGGGARCQSTSATLSNCVLTANIAVEGGGACGGTLISCTLTGNTALGNGAGGSDGGGALVSVLEKCTVLRNSAYAGGGVESCSLINCTVISNTAAVGGGVDRIYSYPESMLTNCTIVGNTATNAGGGTYGGMLKNCIIYGNYCLSASGSNVSSATLNYCWTSDPLFADAAAGDYHLQSNSPCINSGNNAGVTVATDLDGNARIVGGTVDIGAYEYQTPTSVLSYAWAQQYGLPTDGSVDYADLDGTSFNVYQDWIAGLNPTNALSVLAMLPPVPTNNPTGLIVSWESVSNRTYFLQSSTNLGAQPAFSTIQSNLVGQAGTTSFTDTNATNGGPYFYRVGVQQ